MTRFDLSSADPNSRLLTYLYRAAAAEKGRTFAQVKTFRICELPLIVAPITEQHAIRDLVIERWNIAANGGDIQSLQQQIDQVIEQLYGVTGRGAEVNCPNRFAMTTLLSSKDQRRLELREGRSYGSARHHRQSSSRSWSITSTGFSAQRNRRDLRLVTSFLSGLEAIARSLRNVKEVRLLIGNTTNRETLEQIAEGYRRLDLVAEAAEEQSYPKRTESSRMRAETATNIRNAVELMDQTDEAEELVKTLVQLIEEKRLQVKVYTKGRLHAKAYVFTYGQVFDKRGQPVDRQEHGIAIVGSSNLTLSGVTHNTELNVVVHGNDNHEQLVKWFDELWEEALPFDEALMQEMQQSWAGESRAPIRHLHEDALRARARPA